MTIKEIAEFAAKQETTVRRWARKASAKNAVIAGKIAESSPRYPADYSVEEVEAILNESRLGHNAVMIIMSNARREEKIQPHSAAVIDYAMIGQIVAQAVTSAVTTVIQEMNKPVLSRNPDIPIMIPEATKKADRDALRQAINNYAEKRLGGRYRDAWHDLYEEIYYRLHVNVRVRAEHAEISKIDLIERDGLIPQSIAILEELGA